MCLLTLKDGKELPKVIGFEGEDEETASTSLLPQVHMKMENCQPEAEKIILQFSFKDPRTKMSWRNIASM